MESRARGQRRLCVSNPGPSRTGKAAAQTALEPVVTAHSEVGRATGPGSLRARARVPRRDHDTSPKVSLFSKSSDSEWDIPE